MSTKILFCWVLAYAIRGALCSHPGVTRVLPVEGGLTDFRVGLTTGHPSQSTPVSPAAAGAPEAPAPPPPEVVQPSSPPATPLVPPQTPTPVREDSIPPELPVRFPSGDDVAYGNAPVRGVPPYPTMSNNFYPYVPRTPANGLGAATNGVHSPLRPGTDSSTSASGPTSNYKQVGDYIQEASEDSEVTFRDEHSPNILIKNPGFNSVAIGFIIYLILLTALQNSMLNWSQKGALLTLGPTTVQRNQREAVDRSAPEVTPGDLPTTPVATSTTPLSTPAATRGVGVGVDSRARTDPDVHPQLEVDDRDRSPVSVAAILNEEAIPRTDLATDSKRPRTVGPRSFSQIES